MPACAILCHPVPRIVGQSFYSSSFICCLHSIIKRSSGSEQKDGDSSDGVQDAEPMDGRCTQVFSRTVKVHLSIIECAERSGKSKRQCRALSRVVTLASEIRCSPAVKVEGTERTDTEHGLLD